MHTGFPYQKLRYKTQAMKRKVETTEPEGSKTEILDLTRAELRHKIEDIKRTRVEIVDPEANETVTILDLLRVELCAEAILDYIPLRDLVRSEAVCRRWQHAVYNYLRRPFMTLLDVHKYHWRYNKHRCIEIPRHMYSLQLFSRKLEKWFPYIQKVVTNRFDEEFMRIIGSNCPNLRHIEFSEACPPCFPLIVKSLNHIEKFTKLETLSFNCLVTMSCFDELFVLVGQVRWICITKCWDKVIINVLLCATNHHVLSNNYHHFQPVYVPLSECDRIIKSPVRCTNFIECMNNNYKQVGLVQHLQFKNTLIEFKPPSL